LFQGVTVTEEAFAQVTGQQEPVTSAFVIRYHSVLNLWHPESSTRLERLCASSFREYQREAERRKREERCLQQRAQRRRKSKSAKRGIEQYPIAHQQPVVVGQQIGHLARAELYGTIRVLCDLGYINSDASLTLKGSCYAVSSILRALSLLNC